MISTESSNVVEFFLKQKSWLFLILSTSTTTTQWKKNEKKKDLKRYWENQRAISTRINLWFENFRLVLYSWSCFIFLIGIRFTWSLRVNMIYISLPTFSKPGQCQGQIYSLNVCLEFCQFQVRKKNPLKAWKQWQCRYLHVWNSSQFRVTLSYCDLRLLKIS